MAETAHPNHSSEEWLNEKLPVEVQKRISDYLELRDKLALRTVFPKTQHEFVDNALMDTVNTLYVSPSKNSLDNFKLVCSTKYYQQRVTHVVFVPKAIGDEDFREIKSFKKYREQVPALSIEDARHSFCIYRDLVTSGKRSVSLAMYDQGPTKSVVELLRDGMKKLPKLAAASVATAITHDGINANPLWYSEEFGRSKEALGHYVVEQDTASRAAVSALGSSSDDGIDSFFEALGSAKLKLESLTLGEGMARQLYSEIQICTGFDDDCLKSIFSKVKKLSVAYKDLNEHDFSYMWQHIAEIAVNLRELTLYNGAAIYDSFWRTPGDGVPVLDHFLHFGQFPKLEKLHVQGDHIKPGILNSEHFKHFLNKHRDIRSIVVQDMLFSGYAGDICADMKSVFEHARSKMSKDATFSMKVHRRDEHADGGLCTFDGRSDCDGTCEMYLVHGRTWMERSELEGLAHELKVELVDGSWDFGAYVMRA
ncbi:hypothetical protein CLAFUW4_11561 [Fulvia fulva]|uniref:Uncharacterized protein n=1 Tax=Passalora fulva TaxID=5499 RepID=A0A9Q8PCJ2_PASFU|nr:uncharacterized protein CLAFUR5_10604 [Fulvia fulva]KAK4621173.1 hypothetical protein CLAFUR0_11575 [Fulvia fulva]UJO19968.1 hypothetical protein CLAFUR5_10604 [Fulvia fulva]WPV17775.1 hypothetical protein CLAFUW4_11561 [Fulvia fulva]